MAFNIFTTKRVSCFGQYDRIDDLITFKLRGDKRPVQRQLLVDELHVSAVCKCFDPLFVWHFRTSSAEIHVFQECPPCSKNGRSMTRPSPEQCANNLARRRRESRSVRACSFTAYPKRYAQQPDLFPLRVRT